MSCVPYPQIPCCRPLPAFNQHYQALPSNFGLRRSEPCKPTWALGYMRIACGFTEQSSSQHAWSHHTALQQHRQAGMHWRTRQCRRPWPRRLP